ncbi:NupC/NupG family nucleoside CNT transporter [Plebeiibacterium sediminum]|uniref:Na+ dependent nucleoside transporter n=1 Tax=Plebeiibacterium sediminum TaxID=2992112 RepID=A0AAE3M122_9BACT|nr:nucleoside transporter C-terminal domain-containing protein [Plebeiobacterium sediminum]MCW3784835.1 Na+ dependent nucleoside transporter [Plebeiobacterium sediminum]
MVKKIIPAIVILLFTMAQPTWANSVIDYTQGAGVSTMGIFRGILGMAVVIGLAYLASINKKAIDWKVVIGGLGMQLVLAVCVLYIPFVQNVFEFFGKLFTLVLDFTKVGTEFLVGDFLDTSKFGYIFMFQILPTIIFFSALTSVLFYLGVIQKVVWALAWLLTKTLKLSGAESLSVAGNIFLGQTEAPLMIKAYLPKMNPSEMFLVMTGGMATVAGGVLAAYIGFLGGDDPAMRLMFAKHLLTASVMAAPGAVVISKIIVPQRDNIESEVKISMDKIGSNILDAMSNGTSEGLKLAANVGAMLLVFFAFIAMVNYTFTKIGDWTALNDLITQVTNGQYTQFNLEFILGYTMAPLMWLIGVPSDDISQVGQLLGEKIIASEFVGYTSLAKMKAGHLITHSKSIIMATYMLCGFANFASIGIQIGGIGGLAPKKRSFLSKFGIRALIAGTLASLMSATIVGMILG